MRKLSFHPITAMLAAAALLVVLKDQMGDPRTNLRSLALLALFGYGCSLIYLGMLYASPWFIVLKKLTFPDAWKNRVFRSGMAFSGFMMKCLLIAAIALFAFGADPMGVTGIIAALLALSTAAAAIPLADDPGTKTAP